uniref:Uncharacterized protein n=1 Tax=viral metagenome TaxID=1070528 RepID=A0A6C0J047_9ZZZZ
MKKVVSILIGPSYPTLNIEILSNSDKNMLGFSTNFKKITPNQLFITRRIKCLCSSDTNLSYNFGFVVHDGERKDLGKSKGLKDLDGLGSRFLFKHIFKVSNDNTKDLGFYYAHASNWGPRTNYFGSSIKQNDGIDDIGITLKIKEYD